MKSKRNNSRNSKSKGDQISNRTRQKHEAGTIENPITKIRRRKRRIKRIKQLLQNGIIMLDVVLFIWLMLIIVGNVI